jgi:replicative DNA helicase
MSDRVGSIPQGAAAAPPHSMEAEQAVLGAILLWDGALAPLAGDIGLRPEHFYRDRHQTIFAGMLAMHDRGEPVDPLTLAEHLKERGQLEHAGGQEEIDYLTGMVPAVGNAMRYGQAVLDAFVWRTRLGASYEIQLAVQSRDEDAYRSAEATLAQPREEGRKRTLDTVELADELLAELAHEPDTMAWPFARLNKLTMGGARRGQVTVVAGPTSHGKSVIVDMALESMCPPGSGRRAHLFINEMTTLERTMRIVARRGGVPYEAIATNRRDDEQTARMLDAMSPLPFGITDCTGWTAREVCRQIRRGHYDAVGFDIVQRLPHRHQSRVRDLEEASNEFNQVSIDANCHVLVAAHINRARSGLTAAVPFPTLGDIRDTGALANDAPNVLFVWREQDDDTGEPQETGIVRFGKVRNGRQGGLPVRFVGETLHFEPVATLADAIEARDQEPTAA